MLIPRHDPLAIQVLNEKKTIQTDHLAELMDGLYEIIGHEGFSKHIQVYTRTCSVTVFSQNDGFILFFDQ